jgi:putative NADPH-quinone reductase
MRVLHLYCHPCPESFHAAIRARAIEGLHAAGHEVDLLDLYAEGFDPVLGAEERRRYHDPARNRAGVAAAVMRLQRAEGLIVQFPTWCFGPPAMLKGWLDRVLLPGVAFDLGDPAHVRPLLTQLRCVAGIVTYGRPRWAAWWMGDPPRRLVTRYLRWCAAPGARVRYHALYALNTAGDGERRGFLDRVADAMAAF